VGGTKAAAFPVGIALGSTWNVDLLREVGRALVQEARDKGAGVLLAPTVNLLRSTLNGRNFEGYGAGERGPAVLNRRKCLVAGMAKRK
jgi:beta-glucosidase